MCVTLTLDLPRLCGHGALSTAVAEHRRVALLALASPPPRVTVAGTITTKATLQQSKPHHRIGVCVCERERERERVALGSARVHGGGSTWHVP